jgi:hypothetical protein
MVNLLYFLLHRTPLLTGYLEVSIFSGGFMLAGMHCYSANISRNPFSTSFIFTPGKLPTLFVRNDLSRVIICEMLITDSRPKPALRFERDTLPGAFTNDIFDVITAAITVRIRLRLNSSA